MVYFSPDMKPITKATSYYLPSPFVSMSNTYDGTLTMVAGEDEPDQLLVRSYAAGAADPYITVTVKYRRAPTMDLAAPLELTADAGSRVALIARTMGLSSAIELQELLAEIAKGLMWQQYPHYENPAQPAGASAEAPPTH